MNHRYSKAAGALLLALTMTACHSAPPSTVTTVATLPEETKSTLAAVQVQGGDELTKLLDQIEDNVFPGTAGSSLTAVQYTVDLLDWCKTAGVSDSELRSIVSNWMTGKDTAELSRKFELVSDTYQRLMSDTATDLLDSAGVQTDSYPWPEACRQVMATILEVTGADGASDEGVLEGVLTDIRDSWAGTQKDSFRQAAMLLDWAANTADSEEQIRTTLTDWLSAMGNDAQVAFAVDLNRVSTYAQLLLSDEGPSLLEQAELEKRSWPESAIQTIDILLDAAGANGDSGLLGLMNRIADGQDSQVSLAAELLDWAENTALTDDQLRMLGRSWAYSVMKTSRYYDYQDRMDAVYRVAMSLTPEELAAEGIESSGWSQEALNRIRIWYTASGLGTT